MRKNVCVSLLALSFIVSLAAGAAPASAGSVDAMRAQIPFDFHIGDTLVPAGRYTVRALNDGETTLRLSDGRHGASINTNAAQGAVNAERQARLVFRKYGDQYFLAAVWGADNTGRSLPASKTERSLRKETQSARGGMADAETVIVALH
jgi:hypothetical protein